MQSRKNINQICSSCKFRNECKLVKLTEEKRASYCLLIKLPGMLLNPSNDETINRIHQNLFESNQNLFESKLLMDKNNERLEQLEQKLNPVPGNSQSLTLVRASYNEVVKKAFDIGTDSSEAKQLQRSLICARNSVAKFEARKLKRKIAVPLWAYTFLLYHQAGKVISVGFSDRP